MGEVIYEVNDRMRPDTFADYSEKAQWARNTEIDQQGYGEPAPLYDTGADVKQDHFTREELDKAITRLKTIRHQVRIESLQNS